MARLSLARPIILIALVVACDRAAPARRRVHSVSEDGDTAFIVSRADAEMARARRRARCTLPEFVRRFRAPPPGQSALELKARFEEGTETEYLWLEVISVSADTLIRGVVDNDPGILRRVRYQDTVSVGPDAVADWYAVERDTLVAGFTLRVYRERLPPVERAREDSAQGYVVPADPLPPGQLTNRCR
jgi:uncharacterized protein YegJ (DUF2314 family)